MAELIRFLVNSTKASYESFYFVGFDLGAHASGFAGKEISKLQGTTIGRITGISLWNVMYLYFMLEATIYHLQKNREINLS